MNTKLLIIGIDVDEKNFNCFVIEDGSESGRWFKCPPRGKALLKALDHEIKSRASLHFCYESTYSGFALCRELQAAGHECTVIASSLIPKKAGERVKNDRLDAEKIATYFKKGLLTAVYLPSEEDEQERALIRSRQFIKEQHKAVKKHITSMCKRMGWDYIADRGNEAKSFWTIDFRKWLKEKVAGSSPIARLNFEMLLAQVEHLETQIAHYQMQIDLLASEAKYKKKVEALICYKGIDTLTAMTLITEIGDINRFANPRQLASYAGLDVAESSSGGKERRFTITKAGNRRLRTALTETVQGCQNKPMPGTTLRKRRAMIDQKYVSVADRSMARLHKRSIHLLLKGKPINKVKSACARELLGFIWESLRLVS